MIANEDTHGTSDQVKQVFIKGKPVDLHDR
jgi:hypothetical protein